MIVKELLINQNREELYSFYKKKYPLFDDYELEAFSKEEVEATYILFKEKLFELLDRITNMTTNESEGVIFVVPLKSTDFEERYEHIDSFFCKKSEIVEKAKDEFGLWCGENRIEHYAYDFDTLENIISTEVYYKLSDIEAACEIINEILFLGFTDEKRTAKLEEIRNALDEAEASIENGECIDADTFFEELEREILEEATAEEREQIIAKRNERKKNENRDKTYLEVVMRINHKRCIEIVEEYFIEKLLK